MTILSFPAGLAVGPAVGLLATLVMDRVMARLPEGRTPPKVASGVLTGTPVDEAPAQLAAWVHYAAGGGSGVLFVGLVAGLGTILGTGVAAAIALAGVVQLALMIGFFALVPLPRAAGLPRQRLGQIRRDWAVSAATYVVAVAVLLSLAAGI